MGSAKHAKRKRGKALERFSSMIKGAISDYGDVHAVGQRLAQIVEAEWLRRVKRSAQKKTG